MAEEEKIQKEKGEARIALMAARANLEVMINFRKIFDELENN